MKSTDKNTASHVATVTQTRIKHGVKALALTSLLGVAAFSSSVQATVQNAQLSRPHAPCVDANWPTSRLLTLASTAFELPDTERDAMAMRLFSCLAEADPELRDSVAFSGLSQWLRASALKEETVNGLYTKLSKDVRERRNDPDGVYLPFAILTLSEVARVDRVSPFLESSERDALIKLAADTMAGIQDYRGFDENLGWRHQVAHSADLLLQLILNPSLSPTSVVQLIESLQRQLSPTGHFYVYGEPERLARPVLYAMLRDDIPEDFWQSQLTTWTTPVHIDSWDKAFASNTGLAERHNRRAFFSALLFGVSGSKQPRLLALQPAIQAAMKKLP
ncbi:DUF2785 domain-containing protein [Shewanella litorisediminis]|uniref:DUF2785 domain-containing protein n=1 Tax=Shewanella litorisediminis TaxID=1173586 RepID=A0ABX7FZ33_9GAMM|nr:DUF2785 domain-containing protein [Shewanella litorisediminis]MCL2918735.1 DUF2785 domain-containing protein [Shewanella litorisediminis]QRH00294.1 DUF2785 domain-containing protein [Shewanella litorisediminis]